MAALKLDLKQLLFAGGLLTPVGFFVLLIAAPITWVKLAGCSGLQAPLETYQGKPVVAERVSMNAEESTLYNVVKVSVLDPKSGKNAVGPWFHNGAYPLGITADTYWLIDRGGLYGLSLKDGSEVMTPKTLAAKEPAVAGKLLERENAYRLDSRGNVAFTTNDARRWFIAPDLSVHADADAEPEARANHPVLSNHIAELRWEGGGRKKLTGVRTGATLLQPAFVYDSMTAEPIGYNDGWLTAHYERLAEGGAAVGLCFSLVSADTAELWHFASPRGHDEHEQVISAMRTEDVVILQTYLDGHGLVALDLATGKLLWKKGY